MLDPDHVRAVLGFLLGAVGPNVIPVLPHDPVKAVGLIVIIFVRTRVPYLITRAVEPTLGDAKTPLIGCGAVISQLIALVRYAPDLQSLA